MKIRKGMLCSLRQPSTVSRFTWAMPLDYQKISNHV